MKALKIDSTVYTQKIIEAITDCYENTANPSNAELLALYGAIGQCICEQGEKAFVVHLAQALTEQLPQLKGFSPRNLRRMRDFYCTYANQPELMRKAQKLGWTQNAVILDCCETDEQRSFYIALAVEKNLSKLALMKAIEANVFGTVLSAETKQAAVASVCPTVGETAIEAAVDTAAATETVCGAFVPACEPPRQGGTPPNNQMHQNTSFCGVEFCKPPKLMNTKNQQQKRSPYPTPKRSVELLQFAINILYKVCRLPLSNRHPPPHRWQDFRMYEQEIVFA